MPVELFLQHGKMLWAKMDMDYYKGKDDKYDDVGGLPGFLSLLVQYYTFYMDLRVRVIDTEIVFGYNKEVHLGSFYFKEFTDNIFPFHELAKPWLTVSCYLTGR